MKKNTSTKTTITKALFNKELIGLYVCLVAIFIFFIPTLIRPWLIYDERIFADGIYFPFSNSISEMFEILNTFGLNFTVSSSNTFYSSNYVTRTCPFGLVFGMAISLLFKQNPFLYHLFTLGLHLINTALVYFILKTFLPDTKNILTNKYLIPLLTLIWALHPVNMEAVLLTINCGASFTYMFFFALLLDFLKTREHNKSSTLRNIFIPLVYLSAMLTNEYIVALPLVLFVFSFYKTCHNNSFKKAFKKSFTETIPYFIGLACYVFYFLLFTNYRTNQISTDNQSVLLLERISWLSPQIFFHFIKLIIFPIKLSIDQTIFVKLGKTLFDPYSIFCILFLACWLTIPLYLFIVKKKFNNLFLLSFSFFLALFPFLHIIMPSYAIANERYLYTALAMMIISTGKIISEQSSKSTITIANIVLSFILVLCIVRSYSRSLEWKDNYTFISSTYNTSKEPLFKAVRAGMLGKAVSILEPNKILEVQNYFQDTLVLLKKAKEELVEKRLAYQDKLPQIIKSYGLDYDSLLTKIVFLEASTICLELKQDYRLGLNLLSPYITSIEKTDPRVLQLYTHFLILDNQLQKAKNILLKMNSIYPHTPFILLDLIDFYIKYEQNLAVAEKYLIEALKVVPYDKDILLKALSFYQDAPDKSITAKYAYLYGLRTKSKPAYLQALSLYSDLNNVKEAKKIINKLIALDKNDPETLFFISKFYYKTGDYNQAISHLKNALEISKSENLSPSLTFEIAYALTKLHLYVHDKDSAISLAKEIINLTGNDISALEKLAALYQSLGLTEEFNSCTQKIHTIKQT